MKRLAVHVVALLALVVSGGCATQRSVVELDADSPELWLKDDGIYCGSTRVDLDTVVQALEGANIPKSRAIHIRVDRKLIDQRAAWPLMARLRRGGYTRSLLVSGQQSVGISNELRLCADGFRFGSELVNPTAIPVVLERAGVAKGKSLQIFVDGDVVDPLPAHRLRLELKRIGYKYVDVVETQYADQYMFYVSAEGVRYGMLTWVNQSEAVESLRRERAGRSALIRLCGDAKDRASPRVMKIMMELEGVLRQAGYDNIKRFWLEDPRSK